MKLKDIPFKKIFTITFWVLMGAGFVALWVVSVIKQKSVTAKNISTKIDLDENKLFIHQPDVNEIIHGAGYDTLFQKRIQQINYKGLERAMERNPWIEDAEIFTDKNGNISINIKQRCPLIRIINKNGVGFYIDKKGAVMPLNSKFTPRVLVVTGEVNNSDFSASNPEQSKLKEVVKMAEWIANDKFWNAQITQIDVLPNQELELYTLSGDNIIEFGKAEEVEQKFSKLKLFYLEGLNYIGWSKYCRIIIKYNRQIVCVKKEQQLTPHGKHS